MKFPKNLSDYLALGFFVAAIFTVFVFEMTVIQSFLQSTRPDMNMSLHTGMAIIFLVNIYTNLYYLFTTDTSTAKLVLPSSLLSGWHYCISCEANSPPRSYHCNICDRCILRRDHHCIFSACCIGYKNYKYYIGLLFQVSVACIYASVFHCSYIWNNLGGLSPLTFFEHMLPVPFYMFGFINGWTAFVNFLSVLCVIGCLFGSGLLIYHFNLLLKNQTTYERHRLINVYNLKNWQLNLTESLGPNWMWSVCICPWIPSKLPCDGINFPTLDEHKYTQ